MQKNCFLDFSVESRDELVSKWQKKESSTRFKNKQEKIMWALNDLLVSTVSL